MTGNKALELVEYLADQERKCFEETGSLLQIDDIVGNLESEEFIEQFGVMSFAELFNYLVH